MISVLHIFLHPGKFHFELMDAERNLGIDSTGLYYVTRHSQMERIDSPFVVSQQSNTYLRRTPLFFYSRIREAGKKATVRYKANLPSLIHAHMLFSDGSLALDFHDTYGIPYIVAVRNMDLNSAYLWCIPQVRKRGIEILKKAERIVFLAPSYLSRLLDLVPENLKDDVVRRSIISRNGISRYWHLNKAIQSKKTHRPIRVLTVGDICTNKNQVSVARAINTLRSRGLELSYTVVGNSKEADCYNTLSSFDFVQINPFCDKEKLREYYASSDVFALPSFHETFGLVYAEAMSQGLPIVYTKNEGFDGQFTDGQVGFAVDASQVSEVASAIERVIENYENLSSNCIQGCEKFNWADIASEYAHVYKSICSH